MVSNIYVPVLSPVNMSTDAKNQKKHRVLLILIRYLILFLKFLLSDGVMNLEKTALHKLNRKKLLENSVQREITSNTRPCLICHLVQYTAPALYYLLI